MGRERLKRHALLARKWVEYLDLGHYRGCPGTAWHGVHVWLISLLSSLARVSATAHLFVGLRDRLTRPKLDAIVR
jgi:hypothetical protein